MKSEGQQGGGGLSVQTPTLYTHSAFVRTLKLKQTRFFTLTQENHNIPKPVLNKMWQKLLFHQDFRTRFIYLDETILVVCVVFYHLKLLESFTSTMRFQEWWTISSSHWSFFNFSEMCLGTCPTGSCTRCSRSPSQSLCQYATLSQEPVNHPLLVA